MRKLWSGEVGTLKGAFETENLLSKVLGTVGLDGAELGAAVNVAVPDSGRRSPHLLRNFVPSRFGPPQFEQATSSREPQFSRKTASAAFCAGHWVQFTTAPSLRSQKLNVCRSLRPEI